MRSGAWAARLARVPPVTVIPVMFDLRNTETILRVLLVLAALAPVPVQAQTPSDGAPTRLIGIIQSREFTGAVLSDAAGAQFFYRLREQLPDGSRIIGIRDDSIRLKRSDGTTYEMFITHEMKPSAAAPVRPPGPPSGPPASINPLPGPLPASRQLPRTSIEGPGRTRPNRREPSRGAKHSAE